MFVSLRLTSSDIYDIIILRVSLNGRRLSSPFAQRHKYHGVSYVKLSAERRLAVSMDIVMEIILLALATAFVVALCELIKNIKK